MKEMIIYKKGGRNIVKKKEKKVNNVVDKKGSVVFK
jgi:hypothetical protein